MICTDCAHLLIRWNKCITYWVIHLVFFFPKDYMPFRDIYVSTFKNDIEYNQLLVQTAMALQTNKFIQVMNPPRALTSAKENLFVFEGSHSTQQKPVWASSHPSLLIFALFLSLSKPAKTNWTSWGKTLRISGRESRRKWWECLCRKIYPSTNVATRRAFTVN